MAEPRKDVVEFLKERYSFDFDDVKKRFERLIGKDEEVNLVHLFERNIDPELSYFSTEVDRYGLEENVIWVTLKNEVEEE